MITIGITGSIASGKSTVAQLISSKKYPLFSADKVVSQLYKNKKFTRLIVKKFKLKNKRNIKGQIRFLVKKNKKKLIMLEKIIHPAVRKKMKIFLTLKKKILVLEIPLLIESKLNRYFNKIIFVDAKKNLRLKRYLKTHNDRTIFETLNKRQLSPIAKKKTCDFIINNNYSLAILKKNVKKIVKEYE